MNMPKRRHTLEVSVGADSYEELKARVKELFDDLKPDGNGPGLFATPSSGGTWSHTVDKTQTADTYKQKLEAYLAWECA